MKETPKNNSTQNKELKTVELEVMKKIIEDFYLDKEKGVIFLATQSNFDSSITQVEGTNFAEKYKKDLKETTFANFIKIHFSCE